MGIGGFGVGSGLVGGRVGRVGGWLAVGWRWVGGWLAAGMVVGWRPGWTGGRMAGMAGWPGGRVAGCDN
jgi:hypothetical protein